MYFYGMKLADWLAREGLTQTDFAAKLDKGASYVSQLCRGVLWPGRDVVAEIARLTKGAVTANDFAEPVEPQEPSAASAAS